MTEKPKSGTDPDKISKREWADGTAASPDDLDSPERGKGPQTENRIPAGPDAPAEGPRDTETERKT